MMRPFLFFGFILLGTTRAISFDLCTPTAIVFRGTDYVKTAKGQLVLVSFMPLQCDRCRQQLEKLSSLSTSLQGVRVAVLAPHWESYAVIGKIQTEFPRILIDKDVDSSYERLGVVEHEVAIFDKCGRLAHAISAARSEISKFEDTIDTLKSAQSHAICGWCSYGSGGTQTPRKFEEKEISTMETDIPLAGGPIRIARNYGSSIRGFEKVDVWLKAHTSTDTRRDEERRRGPSGQQQRPNPDYGQHRASPTTTDYRYQQNRAPFQAQPRQGSGQNQQQQQQPQRQPINPTKDYRYSQNQQANPVITKQPPQIPINYRGTGSISESPTNPRSGFESTSPKVEQKPSFASGNQFTSLKQAPTTAKTTTTQQSRFVEADYDYYLGTNGELATTELPVQTQIPKPSLQPWWSAPPPTIPLQQQQQQQNLLGEENIPCSAYTDDVCYHQQEKVGTAHISKCCSKKIYFTDLCVPGKCSNSTMQLCCMQKFLQSRYGCCQDEGQSDGDTPTDKFSRCCHDAFTVEDDCCPKAVAKTYWESAHELCFPNTKLHLEKIKMEVRFAEGVRVVDLAENRLWDHECPHGTKRQQYAYVP